MRNDTQESETEHELQEALSHLERADEYRKRRKDRKMKQHLNAAKGLLSRHLERESV